MTLIKKLENIKGEKIAIACQTHEEAKTLVDSLNTITGENCSTYYIADIMCYSLYEYFNTNVWCYSPKDFYEDSNFMIIPFNEFIKNDISCYSKPSFAVRDRAKVIGNTISDHKYPIGSIVTIDYVFDVNENTEHYKVHNTKNKNKHQFIGLVDLAPIDDYESMSYFKLVDYLIDTFYTTDFVNDHTRKELACILRRIKPHEVKQSKNAFNNMCKQRMGYHIEFFIKTHLLQRRKSKGVNEILDNQKFNN